MRKIIGYLSVCILLGISYPLFAQEEVDTIQIYEKIREIVNNAGQSLDEDCDPYGFQVSIKMSKKENGTACDVLDIGRVQGIVSGMLADHQFQKFNLDKPLELYSRDGFIYISVGLTPLNAKDETFAVYFESYTLKQKIDGQFSFFTVQVGAQFITTSPNDGGIAGDVFFKTENGADALLNNQYFLSSTNDRRVRYRRLGPGDETSNSGAPDEDGWWKPFQSRESNFDIVDLTPGHYYPSVKLNGCTQKLENTEKYKDQEVIIKAEGTMRWDNPTLGQKIITPDGVTATKVTNAAIKTTYSTKNTVYGFLLTEGQKPGKWRDHDYIKKEDVQILKTERKVWIEPLGWTCTNTRFPEEQMTTDGTYKFENVPSGVYLVYFDGQKGSGRPVEVCNCDEKNEPTQANLFYQQNMLSEGYEITLDYKFNYEGESFNLKATWGNVVMAFGDENTIPQKYSVNMTPNRDSLDNPLDTVGKILQPPFVIIDDTYFYPACGDSYRYCNDIFRTSPMPPIDFSFSKSGEVLGLVIAEPDFRKNGLYNEFQAVEYKNDAVFPFGVTVEKGIYFTWQFAFDNRLTDETAGGNPIFETMAACENYKFYEDEGGVIPTSHIWGAGTVDARVPEVVIEQIKRGEDFEINKTDAATTYKLSGKIVDKTGTTTATQPLVFKGTNLSVSVYPNPSNDYITLNIAGNDPVSFEGMSYQLFDINGKLIKGEKITNRQSTIKISNLEPANYFVKVIQGNKEINTLKITKL